MKIKKQTLKISILSIFIVLALLLSYLGYLLLERMYPNAMLSLRREFLYLGISAKLAEYEEKTSYATLEDLLKDGRTIIDNSLILVSSDHPINNELSFSNIAEYKDSEIYFDGIAHDAFSRLSSYVLEKYGEKLYITSAYRTREEQEELFAAQGADTAQRPGESEHQTGLALDIAVKGFGGMSFLKTDVGKFVNLSAWKYGFIIRYPDNKTNITKISYEPWHIRYVGEPHAKFIEINRITLEEYFSMFEPDSLYSYHGIDGFAVLKTDGNETFKVPVDYKKLTVSSDNCGNYILTFTIA